jgi:Sulfotransferase domain
MARNHLFTAKVWQNPKIREIRHYFSVPRLYRRVSAGQRRLPDYIIAGAQKSGTTSLWYYLVEHPQVGHAMKKEMHYFDNEYHRGDAWYRLHFPLKWSGASSDTAHRFSLTGESTANYMFHPLAPQRVAKSLPNVKIILLLRNPIDRAFSHYHLKLRRRQETLSFEDAVAAEPERLAGEEEKIVGDPNYYSAAHDRYSYLARGRYLDQILRWQRFVPPERLLILESGEFFRQTADVYQRVLRFLNLSSDQPARFGNRFPGKYQDKMSQATRHELVDYFAPFNEQLYSHLGTRFDWEK